MTILDHYTAQADTAHARAHYEKQARDARTRITPTVRLDVLDRYFADPAYREQVDATRENATARNHLLMDAGQVKYFSGRADEPWFVAVLRDRVITYARAERDYQLLMTAGLSHEEACEIVGAGIDPDIVEGI